MSKDYNELLDGYKRFRKNHAKSIKKDLFQRLSLKGQQPKVMVIACCDSRVDPAIILDCDPGDLFIVRNIASIIPPYEKDNGYHGTSAALEFGVKVLKVNNLLIMGHSQCGGIEALLNKTSLQNYDFIDKWVSILNQSSFKETSFEETSFKETSVDNGVKQALSLSYQHALTFPWIAQAVEEKSLSIHRLFFDISEHSLSEYSEKENRYLNL